MLKLKWYIWLKAACETILGYVDSLSSEPEFLCHVASALATLRIKWGILPPPAAAWLQLQTAAADDTVK